MLLWTVVMRMELIAAPVEAEEEVKGTVPVGKASVPGGRGHHVELHPG
jgi:hypothetical protein